MADQQIPAGVTPPAATTNSDMLGDISLTLPDVSTAGEESMQSETHVPEEAISGENTLLPQTSTNSEVKEESAVINDPTLIDLGDISLNDEATPVSDDVSSTSAVSTETVPTIPEQSNKPEQSDLSDIQIDLPDAPQEQDFPSVAVAPEQISVPTQEEVTTLPTEEAISLPTMETQTTEVEQTIPVQDVAPSLPTEKTDTIINTLIANEQTHITPPSREEENTDATLDLDSLTSGISPQIVETTTPAASSVTLPAATDAQQGTHGAAKKKAFAMAAALVMLIVVGLFVFRTMMPDESAKLFASIFGASSPSSQQSTQTQGVNSGNSIDTGTQNIQTPLVDSGSIATTGSNTGNNITETGVVEQSGNIVVPTNVVTSGGVDASGNVDYTYTATYGLSGSDSTNLNNSGDLNTISIAQASIAVSLIIDQSKKNLVIALKNNTQNVTNILYKTFKDSTKLLETLANTSDISTIPDIGNQINALQQNLHQAITILNVRGINPAGS